MMNGLGFGRYAVWSCVAAAVLAGCGGAQPPIGAPGAMPESPAIAPAHTTAHHIGTASSYRALYSFRGHPKDGLGPMASLIDVDGTLYGTTAGGGPHICDNDFTCGTVYSLTTSGAEKVLHNFGKGTDGYNPQAGVIDVAGTLYGTTKWGGGGSCRDNYGESGCGTVYSVSTTGKERVLYRFAGGSDGAHPVGGLLNVAGTLYGTTSQGGGSGCNSNVGCGTVFSLSTSGVKTVLHSFRGRDGAKPMAALISVKRMLYGTTAAGGAYGFGTVFSISLTGKEHVLHSFGYYSSAYTPDGIGPLASLLDINGTLYGTTANGGACGCSGGTVFSLNATGKEHVLHSFSSPSGGGDGSEPFASLVNVNGTLYGTTVSGGPYGPGTVFSISTTGYEQVLHSFGDGYDGKFPYAGLINVNGKLYGATYEGGKHCESSTRGCGTVFALSP